MSNKKMLSFQRGGNVLVGLPPTQSPSYFVVFYVSAYWLAPTRTTAATAGKNINLLQIQTQ